MVRPLLSSNTSGQRSGEPSVRAANISIDSAACTVSQPARAAGAATGTTAVTPLGAGADGNELAVMATSGNGPADAGRGVAEGGRQ